MTDEKQTDEKLYFINALTSWGAGMLAMVSEESYNRWALGSHKLVVHSPRIVKLNQTQAQPNSSPQQGEVALQLMLLPVFVLRTPQEILAMNPAAVEILGQIEETDDILICKPLSEHSSSIPLLFGDYQKALKNWKFDLAGLASPDAPVPTGHNNPPIPFPGPRT
jgi:hypothetical protein